MNLKQLRLFVQIVYSDLNMSRASEVVHASQTTISKQIILLEEELGVQLFLRKGKRITGLTSAGTDVLEISKRITKDAENILAATRDHKDQSIGKLTIAATSTQISYRLPFIIQKFKKLYPSVQIELHEGTPKECIERVLKGQADLCISTETVHNYLELVALPCYRWSQCIITEHGHRLASYKSLTLADVAEFPIITYDFNVQPDSKVYKTFITQGLSPKIALTATDSRVIKNYVRLGLGIGIVSTTAIDLDQDTDLTILSGAHLFELDTTVIGLYRGIRLRSFAFRFIELYSSKLTREVVEKALYSGEANARLKEQIDATEAGDNII